jgi:hypothetical protein
MQGDPGGSCADLRDRDLCVLVCEHPEAGRGRRRGIWVAGVDRLLEGAFCPLHVASYHQQDPETESGRRGVAGVPGLDRLVACVLGSH